MTNQERVRVRHLQPMDDSTPLAAHGVPAESRLGLSMGESVPEDRAINIRIAEGRVHVSVRMPSGRSFVDALPLDAGLEALLELRDQLPHLITSAQDELEIRDELGSGARTPRRLPDDRSPAAILAIWRATEQRLAAIDEDTLAWHRVRTECEALARDYREAMDARSATAADLGDPPGLATG